MTSSPRFSPDGRRIVMSLQQGGNANIFVMDLGSKRHDARSPTARHRHLAVLLAGRRADRVRERPRRLAADLRDGRPTARTSAASPSARARTRSRPGRRGATYIAFTKQRDGRLRHRRHEARRLGRAHPDRGLPQRGSDLGAERPVHPVLPRSRRRRRGGKLYMVDITGRVEQPVPTPSFASDPTWSPLLSEMRQ